MHWTELVELHFPVHMVVRAYIKNSHTSWYSIDSQKKESFFLFQISHVQNTLPLPVLNSFVLVIEPVDYLIKVNKPYSLQPCTKQLYLKYKCQKFLSTALLGKYILLQILCTFKPSIKHGMYLILSLICSYQSDLLTHLHSERWELVTLHHHHPKPFPRLSVVGDTVYVNKLQRNTYKITDRQPFP